VARQQYSPTKGEVLEPTEARQASSRKMNFRVLIISTALIVVIFAAFTIVFLYQTPASMDASSGPQPSTTSPATNAQP
jgi:type II secretory pathway component PulL